MAGDGDLAEPLRAEVTRLNLEKQVSLLGALPPTKMTQLQQFAGVFVLSSVYEGLPVVVLEALASGTPVVTTRSGETPHLLSPQSGVVCEERTPESLASAINQVLLHPEKFPIDACITSAAPFSARAIVEDICAGMMQRWNRDQAQFLQGVSELTQS